MKRFHLYLILLQSFLLPLTQRNCSDNKILSTVGDNVITQEEFADRYSKFIRLSGIKDNLKIRTEYLNMMIDEKILLKYADTSGWIQREDVKKSLKSLEDQICINYFFQKHILPELKISEEDLREAYYRSKIKIHARHIYAPDLETAKEIKERLNRGESFEELAFEYFTDSYLAYNGGDLGWFSFGDMEPSFEDAAYRLSIGEISQPVKTVYGYSIIQVLEKKVNPFLIEDEFLMMKEKIERDLRKQRVPELMMRKTDEMARSLEITLNDKFVDRLFQKLDRIKMGLQTGKLPPEILPVSSDTTWIVKSKNGTWNVEMLIEKLSELQERQWNRIKTIKDLKKAIKGLVIREEIEKKIDRLRIRDQKEIREKFEKYRKNRILAKLVEEIMDTVSIPESQLLQYYEEHPNDFYKPTFYNISELLVKDSVLAERLSKKLKEGTHFEELARKYSRLKRSREKGGKLGWLSKREAGIVSDFLKPENCGKTIGPIKIKAGYLFIKINDYKPSQRMSFEEAKSEIVDILRIKAQRRGYKNFVNRLRSKANIKINKELLRSISLNVS